MANYELRPRVSNVQAEQITKPLMRNPRAWPQWMIDAWKMDPDEVGSIFIPSNDHAATDSPLWLRTAIGLQEIGWNDYLIEAAGIPIFIDQVAFERRYQLVP